MKVAVVVLIGVSAGLIAVQGDASIAVVGIATGIGLVVGVVLVWIVFPGGDGPRQTGN